MTLMDVKHIADDERVQLALGLIFTALAVYPEVKSCLVSTHATVQMPTICLILQNRRSYFRYTEELRLCSPQSYPL